jgi:hypothetical protein
MGKSSVAIKGNHFPEFARHSKKFGAELVADTANEIEAAVKAKWASTKLPISMRTPSAGGKILAEVVAGSRKRFYAGFLEFGTVGQAPNPAMTGAAENARPGFLARAQALSSGWRV